MKPENIALFKRFCRENGINQLFAGLYRQFHYKEMPDDIERYLAQADARDVIINAFEFPKNLTAYGPSYWLDVAAKWEQTLRNAEKSDFYARCKAKSSWLEQQVSKPLAKALNSDAPRAEQTKDIERPNPKEPERPKVNEEQAALSGFEFFDVTKTERKHLADNEITIGTRSGHRITFSKALSEEIEGKNLKIIRVGVKDKDLYFTFSNDVNGVAWRNNSCNVVISSKDLVEKIMKFLGQKKNYEIYTLSGNLSNSENCLIYKIKKSEKTNSVTFI